MKGARLAVIALAALLVGGLAGCAGRVGAGPTAPQSSVVPSSSPSGAASVTIGALPHRSSLLLHGAAPLAPLDAAMEEDLTTFAKQLGRDPRDVIRDYAAQPAFDQAIRTAEEAHVGFADAVFHAGADAASELRFVRRPPHRVLDALRLDYPRDLRVEWGERLVGDRDRDALSGAVFGIVRRVPSSGDVSTGIDGDGRLTVEFDGAASPRAVADAILAAPSFHRLYVDGQPPTEVRVTQVKNISVTAE